MAHLQIYYKVYLAMNFVQSLLAGKAKRKSRWTIYVYLRYKVRTMAQFLTEML